MKHSVTPHDAPKQAWRRWTDTVELFADRRPGRAQVDARDFGRLREKILALCGSLASPSNDPGQQALYRRIADLVQPFLSPRVLSQADREILLDLLAQCRAAERKLEVRRWRLKNVLPRRHSLAPAAIVLGVTLMLAVMAEAAGWETLAWLRDALRLVWVSLNRLGVLRLP